MKSFASILPFVGLALAQEQCKAATVTKTEVQKVTITVPAVPVVPEATTVTSVKPTRRPYPHHPHHPAPHYPLPNGTYHNSTNLASYTTPSATTLATLSFKLPTDTTGTSIQTLYVTPSPVNAPSSSAAAEASSAAASTIPSASPSETAPVETSPVEPAGAVISGKATSYGGNLAGGNCMFDGGYTLPAGILGTAYSGQNWDASKCGVCVSVTGPNGKPTKVMIVDKCPECDPTHLDLFANAFTAVSGQAPGIIPISYTEVPCGITSPIILKNKSGTSAYYFSMQVENANVGVKSLEVSTDGGKTWKGTRREEYNFFEQSSGFGAATVDVRVTSVNGGTVVTKGVKVASNVQTNGSGNFA
jgi:expansin (peptidoglycan-binding protein)